MSMKSKSKCTDCLKEKDVDQFYKKVQKTGYISYSSRCIPCLKIYYAKKHTKYLWKEKTVPDLEGEIWKDIVGFEGLYKISNFGRVKSYPKYNCPIEKILSSTIQTSGRYSVPLYSKNYEKGFKRFSLHRIIAMAYIPNPENKPCINHIDNNPLNNSIENLEWCTYKENTEHAAKCGRMERGTNRHSSVLTEKQVLEIFNSNKGQYELAKIYKVQQSTISVIKRGKGWSWLTGKK